MKSISITIPPGKLQTELMQGLAHYQRMVEDAGKVELFSQLAPGTPAHTSGSGTSQTPPTPH